MGKVKFVSGSLLVALMLLTTLIGLFYTPHPPNQMNIEQRLEGPTLQHPLGTDNYGRDILSRIMVGGRPALQAGAFAVILGMTIGTILGAITGYFGGWIDEALMRLTDGLYALPAILMALLAATILGPGQTSILVAVALANIPIFSRLTRTLFLSLREREYVAAARAMGSKNWRIVFVHILPNCMPTLFVQASVSFAAAVLAEASLSYLGLGTQIPYASWGRMLREAQAFASLAPWAAVFPGLAIALTVLGFNRLGDGLRDLLDPKN